MLDKVKELGIKDPKEVLTRYEEVGSTATKMIQSEIAMVAPVDFQTMQRQLGGDGGDFIMT